ncbi:MAG: magnesium transporter [Thioalkalispiraceae bacterium]|jgi:magnesium transporter
MSATIEKEEAKDILQAFIEAIHEADIDRIDELLEDMHPAEISHLLESLPVNDREVIWQHIPSELGGEILLHLNDEARASFISKMEPAELVAATETLETDDLADILPDIPRDISHELLLSMEQEDREQLRSVLSYPEDSAGGLMDLNTVVVRADTTLDVVLRYLRRLGEIPEHTNNLFVVDRDGIYQGRLALTDLLINEPACYVHEIMQYDDEGIPADMSARDVAILFERRDLITAPVVNEEGLLLGRITIDDVVDVIRDEADHSLMSMAGLNEEEDMFAPVITSTRRRSVWLGINLMTAFLASWVIGQFDQTIEKLVALAILMPIVASMGGIAGSQTLTLVIRGMALGQIGSSNARRLVVKEALVGVWNGLIWAVVIAGVAGLWFDSLKLAIIIAAAILINLVIAALSGATIPLILKRLGADPALSGTVVLTTVTDVIGFLAFLGLASLFLV